MSSPLRVICVRRRDGDVSHIGVASAFLPAIPIAKARAQRELDANPRAYFVVDPEGVHRPLAIGPAGELVVMPDRTRVADASWLPEFQLGVVPEWAFSD